MIPPIASDHPAEWHQEKFARFARNKLEIGEPTPHMRVLVHLSQNVRPAEQVWRVGLYGAGYSLLTAEALWQHWPLERFLAEREDFLSWLREHWPGIHTRKPRRCVRTPEAFAEFLFSYLDWAEREFAELPGADYERWWKSLNQVQFAGRYIVIRMLEAFRRFGFMTAELGDIRAIGAHSPIRCLMLLYPAQAEGLAGGNPKYVNDMAELHRRAAQDWAGMPINHFAYAALLCEYRASYEDQADYPGNQTDEELSYWNSKYGDYWREQGAHFELMNARLEVHPQRCLGEVNGWQGRRMDVAALLRERGIVWSDLDYSYPVLRDTGILTIQ